MIVHAVDFAECRAHLAYPGDEAARQRGKSYVAFLQSDPLFPEGEEEVAASVGINDRLHSQFGFMHLERGRRANRIATRHCNKVANHADVGIQRLRRRTSRAAKAHLGGGDAFHRGRRRRLSGHGRGRSSWRLTPLSLQGSHLPFESDQTVFQIANLLFECSRISSRRRAASLLRKPHGRNEQCKNTRRDQRFHAKLLY